MFNQSTTINKTLAYSLVLILAYAITGKLGLMLAIPPGYASAIFPPAGIAVAAVFVAGRALLPAIFAGSLLLNIWVGYSTQHQINITNIEVAALIAAASVLQAYVGGWWLKRKIGYPTSLDNPTDVVIFFISAPAICLISATISVSGLYALGLVGPSLFFTSWASWWIGDSLGLIVLLPLCLVAIGQPRSIWKKRLYTVAVPMAVIFALLIVIFVTVSRWERKESLVEFDALSNQLSEHLRLRFESQEAVLKQTSALFSYRANDKVTRKDFHHYVSATLAGYPMIYAIEWLPSVTQQARSAFVKQQRQHSPTFEIKQFNAKKEMVVAKQRDEYFPITYIEPNNEATRAMLGFDLALLSDRKQVILNAINTRQAVATPPTLLINDGGTELGFLLMYPIVGTKQDGVICSIFKAERFFGELFNATKNTINARLIDIQSGEAIYNGFVEQNTEVLYSREFRFGARLYRLETAPTALYYQHHRGWQSWNMLAIGLFGTGLMGVLLLMGTGYTARIENLVKQKTEELKESFSRFQEITSTLGQGIYVMDTEGMITFTNPKAQDLLGRGEFELLGKNAYALFHNEHHDESPSAEHECHICNVMHSKQPYKSAEEIFWHKDGSPIYIALSAVPLFRGDEVVGAVVVFDDISERKKIEHALRASEKSFREIIEHAPIGMAIVSLEGRFMIVNQTLCNIVDYTSDELRRLTFQEITHPEDLSIDLDYVQQLLDGKIDTYQMEKRYLRKDKGVVWIQLSASVFRDEDQSPQYFIAQIENITDRKNRDNEIKQDAYFDTLTTLPNRKMLMDRLQNALVQAERYQRTVALFFIDLDHFKEINDTLGHDVGDLILKESALRLLSCVRINDTVARLGGDEFVIVLSEISSVRAAQVVAEKILSRFADPIDANGKKVLIGTSIGVAVRTGDMKININQLMKNADIAMYQSKTAGRNRCSFYDAI